MCSHGGWYAALCAAVYYPLTRARRRRRAAPPPRAWAPGLLSDQHDHNVNIHEGGATSIMVESDSIGFLIATLENSDIVGVLYRAKTSVDQLAVKNGGKRRTGSNNYCMNGNDIVINWLAPYCLLQEHPTKQRVSILHTGCVTGEGGGPFDYNGIAMLTRTNCACTMTHTTQHSTMSPQHNTTQHNTTQTMLN